MPKDEWNYPTAPVIDNPMIDLTRWPTDVRDERDKRDDDEPGSDEEDHAVCSE